MTRRHPRARRLPPAPASLPLLPLPPPASCRRAGVAGVPALFRAAVGGMVRSATDGALRRLAADLAE
jgi:hypothetical protein